MPGKFTGTYKPRGRVVRPKKNVKRAARQFRRASKNAKRGGAKAFVRKLDAAKRVERARANARRAAKSGSMAKLKSYRTNRANPRAGTLPIGLGRQSEICRMRRVIRIDTSNYNRGEGSTPSLIFNMNDPLCPDLIYGTDIQQSSNGSNILVVDRAKSAAAGYDSANMRYKKGVVLRSKLTAEWLRKPMAHIQEAPGIGWTTQADGQAVKDSRFYRRDDLTLAGTAGDDDSLNAAGRLVTADRMKYDSSITYEPSPPAYMITQVANNSTLYGKPFDHAFLKWGEINPPYIQQPANTIVDTTVALLQRTANKENSLKFRLVPEARREQRHTFEYLYERHKHHTMSAHGALADLSGDSTYTPTGTAPSAMADGLAKRRGMENENDSFFFTNALKNLMMQKTEQSTGIATTTQRINPEAMDPCDHPSATTSVRIQMLPEDTAPYIRHRTAQGTAHNIVEGDPDDNNAQQRTTQDYMGASFHTNTSIVHGDLFNTTTDNDESGGTGVLGRLKPLTYADVPAAKALGQGQMTVTIDYIVLCTQPWTSEELQIAHADDLFTVKEETNAMDADDAIFKSTNTGEQYAGGKRQRVEEHGDQTIIEEVGATSTTTTQDNIDPQYQVPFNGDRP